MIKLLLGRKEAKKISCERDGKTINLKWFLPRIVFNPTITTNTIN